MSPNDDSLRLADVNLNLLVALDALLDAGTVTGAAQRTGVTQSAMSHALRQLRELLGDPLLVRGAGGLVPTPRAEALRVPIRRALLDLQHALRDPPSFDPATAQRRFQLGTGDYFAHIVLPPLLQRSLDTPGIDLDVLPFSAATDLPKLGTGELDLALGAFVPDAPGLCRAHLFTDGFVCLVRREHPVVRRRLTLRQYVQLPHVLISPTGTGSSPVDEQLAAQGLRRRIALRIRYFLAAPMVVATSDLVLTAPRRLGEVFARHFDLQLHEPPVALQPFTVVQLWHQRFDADPGHRWLRERVHAAVAG
jgi:DNA-binding transcriptional LysR family regulator